MKNLMILTMTLLLLVASTVIADPGGGRGFRNPGMNCDGPGHPGGMGMKAPRGRGHDGPGLLAVADEIGLTDQQSEQLKKLSVEHKTAMVDYGAAVQKANIKLRSLQQDENASEAAVMSAIDEVSRLKADMQKARYRHRTQVMGLLTDEQKDKLEELRKERREGRSEKRQGLRSRNSGSGWGDDDGN